MNKNRRRLTALVAAALTGSAACAAGLVATAAHGQDQGNARLALTLFRGDLNNISLGSWGSGNAEPTKEANFTGSTGLKITTHGLYQGGRIAFNDPVDLGAALSNPRAYMRFEVKFTGGSSSGQAVYGGNFGGDGPAGRGGPPAGFSGGGRPGGGFGGPPAGFGGSGGPPAGYGGFGGGASSDSGAAPFRNIRFVLTMADGASVELVRPLDLPPADDKSGGWVPVNFPMSAIAKKMKGASGEGAKLKSIAIFGDKFQQFYVGEIRVLTDETEISVQPLDDQIVFSQQPTIFAANADGGASTLKFSWDFDASDGIQEDAVGRAVYHTFPKQVTASGTKKYTVTLTVSDVDGLKKPVSVTQDIDVSD